MLASILRFAVIPMAIMLFMTGTSQAGTAGWSEYGRVAALQATIHGRYLIKMELPKNPSGCHDKEWYYRDYGGGAGPEYMYQALLSAVTLSKPVRVYVSGVCDLNGYAEITSVQIAP